MALIVDTPVRVFFDNDSDYRVNRKDHSKILYGRATPTVSSGQPFFLYHKPKRPQEELLRDSLVGVIGQVVEATPYGIAPAQSGQPIFLYHKQKRPPEELLRDSLMGIMGQVLESTPYGLASVNLTLTAVTGTYTLTGESASIGPVSLQNLVRRSLPGPGVGPFSNLQFLAAPASTYLPPSPNVTVSLSGLTATFTTGTVSATAGGGFSPALTGITGTFTTGMLTESGGLPYGVNQALTGVTGTFSQGTVGVYIPPVTLALQGITAYFSQGFFSPVGGLYAKQGSDDAFRDWQSQSKDERAKTRRIAQHLVKKRRTEDEEQRVREALEQERTKLEREQHEQLLAQAKLIAGKSEEELTDEERTLRLIASMLRAIK